MRQPPSSGSLKVAAMIADGEPVDWTAVVEDPDVAGRRGGFRILEAVAETHRRAAREEGEAGRHPRIHRLDPEDPAGGAALG
ncbi:MAG TPA: hypothetical protein VNI57_13695 [Candidatus Saccharimonadales bacterium]|nr:hypothetical protein [Candidatus Saccharimonadales bacterium]